MLIVDLCVSYLMDQRSLILKLFLGYVNFFSVGRIRTGHTDLIPLQVCGNFWRRCRFLWFPINWLASNKSSQVLKVCSCVDNVLTMGHKVPLGQSLANGMCSTLRLFVTFLWLWEIVCFIVGPRGKNIHWENSLHFLCVSY